MSRTKRNNRPSTLAYYRGSYYGRGWLPARFYPFDRIFKAPILPDGKATEVPAGKRFKSVYKRMARRRVAHAIRTYDWLRATAPEVRCEWKDAWY